MKPLSNASLYLPTTQPNLFIEEINMATYATTVKCGDKSYNLSVSGRDVYYSRSSKTGGSRLKGINCYNNQLRNSSNKLATDFELAQAIMNCR